MLEITAFTAWTVFVAYATWYFTSAKHTTQISPNEAKLLWKIRKQALQCNATARAPTIQVEMEPSITERFGIPSHPPEVSRK